MLLNILKNKIEIYKNVTQSASLKELYACTFKMSIKKKRKKKSSMKK